MEAQEQKIKDIIEDVNENLQQQISQKLKKIDEKFVQLRKDFDFERI